MKFISPDHFLIISIALCVGYISMKTPYMAVGVIFYGLMIIARRQTAHIKEVSNHQQKIEAMLANLTKEKAKDDSAKSDQN